MHAPYPLQTQIVYILGVNLIQWAITMSIIGTPDHKPVGWVGVSQHGIGDWREIFDRT